MGNLLYAQSGGMTAVINATASALIKQAQIESKIDQILVANNGISGILQETFFNVTNLSPEALNLLSYTPGGAFGSSRYKIKPEDLARIQAVFEAHNIEYFFFNGGNDSQQNTFDIAQYLSTSPLQTCCIGIPKTIDNDLPHTDQSPGFGSAAKFLANTILNTSLDLAAMSHTSTSVFILETMGRHSGWLAASCGLAKNKIYSAPHLILMPEITFHPESFIEKVKETIKREKFCVIAASEGLRNQQGELLLSKQEQDSFGNSRLGGIAPFLASLLEASGLKTQWAVMSYLQRSCGQIVSMVDWQQASAVGKEAVIAALNGQTNVMMNIERLTSKPYQWQVSSIDLAHIVGIEYGLPRHFIDDEGFGLSDEGYTHLLPLIEGERSPSYKQGLSEFLPHNYFNQLEKRLLSNYPLSD